jgi:hypothetical protein
MWKIRDLGRRRGFGRYRWWLASQLSFAAFGAVAGQHLAKFGNEVHPDP